MATHAAAARISGLPLREEAVPLDDEVLARAAASGDREAFALLVSRYRGFIYTIVYRIVLHRDDALDVTQAVMLRLVEKIDRFDGRGSFKGWLATLTSREAIDFMRRPSRRESCIEPDTMARLCEAVPGPEESPRRALAERERRELVEGEMHRLSPQQRAIVALRLELGLGPKEIAGRLGLNSQQVRSQFHRAVQKLRRALGRKL